ncbi:MAG: outer membrane beta-barrel protein [Alphaproteobacteria bacterium]|nr:outer membrane beta-barrel protein [Alphaproteobacteria bacterium]
MNNIVHIFCLCTCIILFQPCYAAPGSVYKDAEINSNATRAPHKPSYIYEIPKKTINIETGSDSDVRFVVEYQVDLFSSAKSTLSISNDYFKSFVKSKGTYMNQNGMLLVGVQFSELNVQLGFTANRTEMADNESTNLGIGLRLPMSKGSLQPYIEASVWHSMLDNESIEDNVSGTGFGLEGGLLYNLTNKVYIRGGIAYGYTKFTEDVSNIKTTLENTTWSFNTALGYRF